jgi:hypothetical protein
MIFGCRTPSCSDEEQDALVDRQAARITVLPDREPANELHREIRLPGVGDARVEHLGDARVVHQRQGLPLGLEARRHISRVPARTHHLHRDAAAYGAGFFGLVHRPHTAFAQELENPVGTYALRLLYLGCAHV